MANSTPQANQTPDDDGVIQIPTASVPPPMANSPHPSQNDMFPAKINGQEVMLTREQAVAHLQKDMAGDEKLRQAADIQKEAASAIAQQADMRAVMEDGDPDALRRLGASMGIRGDEVEKIVEQFTEDDGLDEDDEDVVAAFNQKKQVVQDNKPIDYSRLSPDIQRIVRNAERTRIKEFVDIALDKDDVVSYNMNRLSDKGQETVRKLVDEKVRGRLDGIGGDFGDGSQILPEIVNEVRDLFTDALGSPERTHGSMSLGSAPGADGTEIYPQKLPDHVSSSDGDAWTQNIMETIQFHHRNAEKGKR